MEWTKKIREDLILDDKDFDLLVGGNEQESYYIALVIMLECIENIVPEIQMKDLEKFYCFFDDKTMRIQRILVDLKKIYYTFKTSNYNLYIYYFDKYYQKILYEIEHETSPVLRTKKAEILNELNYISDYIGKSATHETRFLINRDKFQYNSGFQAFAYMSEDTTIFIDIFSSFFSKLDLQNRLKVLIGNIGDISKELEVGGIIKEMENANSILAELSEGKMNFRIDFRKIGSIKGVNLIRLMKYWEICGDIEVENWFGDDTGWNIKLIKKGNHQYIKELKIDSVILFDGSVVPITPNQYIIIEKFTKSSKIDVPISHVDLKITKDAFKKNITRLNKSLGGKVRIGKVRGKNLWHFIKGDN